MDFVHIKKVVTRAAGMSLLLVVFTLVACGKTGPLYLPDDAPSKSEKAQ